MRPAGRIALVGVYGRPAEVDLQAVVFREQTILGNRVYTPADIDTALDLLREDGEAIRRVISESVPLTGVAAAFDRIRAGRSTKVVVTLEGAVMLSLVKTEPGEGHLALLVRPAPEPAPGWVRIEVIYAGICGTDLHILHGRFPSWPPVTLGHELVGRVDALGEGVDTTWMDARVVSEPHSGACTTCHLCRRGLAELCASKRSPGWGIDGAFSRYLTMPADLLHRVPDAMPDRVAVLSEPMAVAVTALLRARVDPGDVVLVVGAGPVGILLAVAAQQMGAGRIVVAGREGSDRLRFAAGLGFDTSDAASADEAVRATSGRGADLVVDASGTADGIALAIGAAKRAGRMVAVGLSGAPRLSVPWDLAVSQALDRDVLDEFVIQGLGSGDRDPGADGDGP